MDQVPGEEYLRAFAHREWTLLSKWPLWILVNNPQRYTPLVKNLTPLINNISIYNVTINFPLNQVILREKPRQSAKSNKKAKQSDLHLDKKL